MCSKRHLNRNSLSRVTSHSIHTMKLLKITLKHHH